jgi:hypothetical protein
MKQIKRMRARLALDKLKESKTWIASKKMILETDEGDLEIEKGKQVILGATEDGDLAIKDPATVVIVTDDALATKIVDAMKSADSLSDVEFIEKPAIDAALDGTSLEDIVDGLADAVAGEEDAEADDGENVEVAAVSAEDESVEEKCAKIADNKLECGKSCHCEALMIDEEDEAPIDMNMVAADSNSSSDMGSYEEFKAAVQGMNGTVAPGDAEIAFDAEGKAIGYWDTVNNTGKMFAQGFDSADDMMNADASAEVPATQPADFEADLGAEQTEALESVLEAYDASEKSAKDLVEMTEKLAELGLSESAIATVANSFVARSLKEGVLVFDTKLGKNVRAFKEDVEAKQWIADAAEEGRFKKRFIA